LVGLAWTIDRGAVSTILLLVRGVVATIIVVVGRRALVAISSLVVVVPSLLLGGILLITIVTITIVIAIIIIIIITIIVVVAPVRSVIIVILVVIGIGDGDLRDIIRHDIIDCLCGIRGESRSRSGIGSEARGIERRFGAGLGVLSNAMSIFFLLFSTLREGEGEAGDKRKV